MKTPLIDRALAFIRENPGKSKSAVMRGAGCNTKGPARKRIFRRLEAQGLIRIEVDTPTFSRVYPVVKRK